MKKNTIPVLIVVGLIFVLLLFIGVSTVIDSLTPSKEQANLNDYYELTDESQVPIILDREILSDHATLINGEVYLDYYFVYHNINSRFYWDSNENILLYTTATNVISAEAEVTSYLTGKASTDFGKTIVKATADSALIHLDFIAQFSNVAVSYYTNPTRITITTSTSEVLSSSAKNEAAVRLEAHIKSPILTTLSPSDKAIVLSTEGNWHKVLTADGLIGYTETKKLSSPASETITTGKQDEVFTHIKKEKPINLLWHQTTTATANGKISSVLSGSKGVNVVSPTWFKLKDNEGNISSLASKDYVDYCHSQGVEVWGLITNFELKDIDTTYVLTHTSTRQNLVNQLVAKALQYNLDGINIDFESMNGPKVGDAYIQFLRELSIKCKNNDLILSTDVPVPEPYNDFYSYKEQSNFVDYIIVMGYDEHYGQKSGVGSVASLNWTENAIETLLNRGIPSDQIVLGMPFYTKLWSQTPRSDESSAEVTYIIGFENLGMNTAKKWLLNNVGPQTSWTWLEDCGQYYGETTKNGIIYKMWLEDTTSLEKRLQMMTSHNLAGAAFWKSGLEASEVWDIIIKYIN